MLGEACPCARPRDSTGGGVGLPRRAPLRGGARPSRAGLPPSRAAAGWSGRGGRWASPAPGQGLHCVHRPPGCLWELPTHGTFRSDSTSNFSAIWFPISTYATIFCRLPARAYLDSRHSASTPYKSTTSTTRGSTD